MKLRAFFVLRVCMYSSVYYICSLCTLPVFDVDDREAAKQREYRMFIMGEQMSWRNTWGGPHLFSGSDAYGL